MSHHERRASSRPTTRFQPACIKIDGATSVALMRDLTLGGAGFESDMALKEGQPISYRWGNEHFREARVAWIGNGRFGVENLNAEANNLFNPEFPYRSVRIPTSMPATVYVGSRRHDSEVVNLAHRGLCVLLAEKVAKGSLATVKIGRNVFESVTFKWSEGEENGIALSTPLKINQMAAVLQNAAA